MPRIFISYRRDDSAGHAGRLYDRLVEHFGSDAVFMDIDTILPGQNFVKVIEKEVSASDVLLAIIGKQWLSITDRSGRRRLDNPKDYVRFEIVTALDQDIWVIPVLVQGAVVPPAEQLPGSLAGLSERHGMELRDARWRSDVDKLIHLLESRLEYSQSLSHVHNGSQDDHYHRPGIHEVNPASTTTQDRMVAPINTSAQRQTSLDKLLPFGPIIHGNTVVWHRHWIVLMKELIGPTISLLLWLLLPYILPMLRISDPTMIIIILGLTCLSVAFYFYWQYEIWRGDVYILEGNKIIDAIRLPFGLFEEQREVSLGAITNITIVIPNFIAGIFGYGNVLIETTSQKGNFVFDHIPDPHLVRRVVLANYDELRKTYHQLHR